MRRDLEVRREEHRAGLKQPGSVLEDQRPAYQESRELARDRSALGRVDVLTRDEGPRRIVTPDYMYCLRDSETVLLRHVGAFRAIRVVDLQRFAYGLEGTRFRADTCRLGRKGLIVSRSRVDPRSGRSDTMITLTKPGAEAARSCFADPRQLVYRNVARPAALSHDADVYRMYQAAASRIENGGGRVRRVVLDYELVSQFNRSINHNAESEDAAIRAELARRQGLPIVRGRVQIPDLRIEYEAAVGGLARVDLELATANYRRAQLVAKQLAGFTLYATASDAGRLQSVLEHHDLTIEILSL